MAVAAELRVVDPLRGDVDNLECTGNRRCGGPRDLHSRNCRFDGFGDRSEAWTVASPLAVRDVQFHQHFAFEWNARVRGMVLAHVCAM